MTREDAFSLLNEYTKGPGLLKHALSVEAVMREYARKLGGDEDVWGIVGLLHDFDYEKFPDPQYHPQEGAKILKEKGYPEEVICAILTHASYLELPRNNPVEKALYAVDELCGFIIAVALVQPNKKLAEVAVKSVRKKMKDKAFARQVSREDIIKGAENLGIDLDTHIQTVITTLQKISDTLGL